MNTPPDQFVQEFKDRLYKSMSKSQSRSIYGNVQAAGDILKKMLEKNSCLPKKGKTLCEIFGMEQSLPDQQRL